MTDEHCYQVNKGRRYKLAICGSILLMPAAAYAIAFGILWGRSHRSTSSSSSSFIPIGDSEWNTTEEVIPSVPPSASFGPIIGMQTVHSALLPSGKVILASGSSWRNNFSNTEVYPYFSKPLSGTGLFRSHENPFEL